MKSVIHDAVIRRCTSCTVPAAEGARFCARCGASLDQKGLVRSATRVTPLLQKWRQLSRTLTRRDVRVLLGEPLRIDVPRPSDMGHHEEWRYVYEMLDSDRESIEGVLRFCPQDGRLLSWNEPDWSVVTAQVASGRK